MSFYSKTELRTWQLANIKKNKKFELEFEFESESEHVRDRSITTTITLYTPCVCPSCSSTFKIQVNTFKIVFCLSATSSQDLELLFALDQREFSSGVGV